MYNGRCQFNAYRAHGQDVTQEMERNKATADLIAWPVSACLLLCFSPFPVQHLSGCDKRERTVRSVLNGPSVLFYHNHPSLRARYMWLIWSSNCMLGYGEKLERRARATTFPSMFPHRFIFSCYYAIVNKLLAVFLEQINYRVLESRKG